MRFFTKLFWVDATERAIKSGAQFVLLTLGFGLGAGTATGETAQTVNAFLLDWRVLAGAFLGGIFLSYVTSLASANVGDTNSASLVVDTKIAKK